jgi:hypothetical protein
MDELVLRALYMNASTMDRLIKTCDYLDHTIYSASEIETALSKIVQLGLCSQSGDIWHPIKHRDDKFLFSPP